MVRSLSEFVVFFSLFKYFLFNVLTVAQGFGLALLLREQYLHRREFLEEEFVPSPSEPLLSEEPPPAVEEPSTEPVAAPEIPKPLPDSSHHKVDELDESLIPKGFKVDVTLENMRGTDVSNASDSSDFSVVVHEHDPYSAAAAFEDDDEDTFAPVPSSETSPLPPIDYDQADESSDDSAENRGVSPLAVQLLGEDYDFQSLVETSAKNDEEPGANLDTGIPTPTDDGNRTESSSPSGSPTAQESAPHQWIEPAFSREMVEVLLVEPDRPTGLIFTVDTSPMLAKRRKSKPT